MKIQEAASWYYQYALFERTQHIYRDSLLRAAWLRIRDLSTEL